MGKQSVRPPYTGIHSSDLSATMKLQELENGNTTITITLRNTIDGATYNIHVHDAADPSTTPNGTPYNEAPNADILAQSVSGNGGTVAVSQEAKMSYNDLITTYSGFFVIHDPLQAISTTDISTFLVVSTFAREQNAISFNTTTFAYDFNAGQIDPAFAYAGSHADNLSVAVRVDELADNRSRITVSIMNTIDGETYHAHAHDVADPSTTPNGTPYNEMPNGDVFAFPITGNGGTAAHANISSQSYSDVTIAYEGFFVIHDPLQAISTIDPTTFVILGLFAR